MGAFYVNCCVRGVDPTELLDRLRRDQDVGYVGPSENGWTAFVTADLEKQNEKTIESHGRALTQESDRVALTFLCHDEDLFKIYLFADGSKLGEFNSSPAYFYDHGEFDPDTMTFSNPPPSEQDSKPALHGAEAFAQMFNLDRNLLERLSTPDLTEEAIELHARWNEALGLPSYAVGVGFRYVERGEGDVEWTQT